MERAKQFRFLDLPTELRSHIYELHFKGSKVFIPKKEVQYHPPGLLLSCKLIYNEAVFTYYCNASFYVFKRQELVWFLNIPKHFQSVITDIRIYWNRYRSEPFQHEVDRCGDEVEEMGANLQRGVIHVPVHTGYSDNMVWTNGSKVAGHEGFYELLWAHTEAEIVEERLASSRGVKVLGTWW